MRLSCSGCRVLRKGCGDDCTIRPCLEWIKSPESQANATVFLAKFYGRAGLMNLINVGPAHLRPAIFRSLLYESCGRIVNPIYGSVGLMCSGNWNLCNAAVEAVLNGAPITPMAATDAAEAKNGPSLNAYDIRHVNKEDNLSGKDRLRRVRRRTRFKRSGTSKSKPDRVSIVEDIDSQDEVMISNESSLSHQSEAAAASPGLDRISRASESLGSADTAEQGGEVERKSDDDENSDGNVEEIELDLSLGFQPVNRCPRAKELRRTGTGGLKDNDGEFCKMRLGLD